jgi:ligand-binding sensor domain-containing protein
MKKVCLILFLLFFLFRMHSYAQQPLQSQYSVRATGEEEKLEPWYYCIIAKSGLLWATTINALSSYDGQSFHHYTVSDGLPSGSITWLAADTSGLIYVSTLQQISRFTGSLKNKFYTYPPLPGNAVLTYFCAADSSHLYASGGTAGSMYYYNNGKWSAVACKDTAVSQLCTDKAGICYGVSAGGSLYSFANGQCRRLYKEESGRSCIAKTGRNGVVYFYNGKVLSDISPAGLRTIISLPLAVPAANMAPMLINDAGAALLAAGNTLIRISKAGADTVHTVSGNLFSTILDITQDNNGTVYFTNRNLFRLSRHAGLGGAEPVEASSRFIINYTKNGAKYRSPADPSLFANLSAGDRKKLAGFAANYRYLYKDMHDTVWVCSNAGLYTLTGGLHLRYLPPPLYHTVHDSTFHNISESADGTLWISSFNGLIKYSKGSFERLLPSATDPFANGIYNSSINKRGDVLLSTSAGAFAYSSGRFTDLGKLLHFAPGISYHLLTMPNGKTWISIFGRKIYGIEPSGKDGFVLTDSLAQNWDKKTMTVRAMQRDTAGNLWVYDGNNITAFIKDGAGNLDAARRVVLTAADGVPQWKSTLFVLSMQEDGRMRFEKRDSAMLLNPAAIIAEKHAKPIVVIASLLLQRLPVDWDSLGFRTNEYGVPVAPAFSYWQNDFTFQFTAADHLHSSYVKYRYRLSGTDDTWQPETADHSADYNNLKPGSYSFEVQAADINDVWSDTTRYDFTISPPWYKTTAAFIFYWILLGAFIYVLFQLRINYIRRKESVKRIIAEQKLKALRAQINPHFLQNTFSFLSQSLEEKPLGEAQKIICKLSQYLRNVLYLTDRNTLTLEDELAFSAEYLSVSRMLFKESFSCDIKIEDDVDTFGIKVPSMLLQPVLENAVKYGASHTGSKGAFISMHVYNEGVYTCCRIENSIIQTPAAEQQKDYKSMGLNITKERLLLMYEKAKERPYIEMNTKDNIFSVIIGIPI